MKKIIVPLALLSAVSVMADSSFFCVGDEIQTDATYDTNGNLYSYTGWEGKVVGIYSNGDLSLQRYGSIGAARWKERNIARGNGCTRDRKYCVGDEITTDATYDTNGNLYSYTGWTGTVVGVYSNGDLSLIRYGDSGPSRWNQEHVSKDYGCTDVHRCVERMSLITNSGQQDGRLIEAKVSTSQSKSGSSESLSDGDQKAPASSESGTAI